MFIWIYLLVKEFGVENKELVDICVKVGIKGKGFVLVSFDDDEVIKIKVFFVVNFGVK